MKSIENEFEEAFANTVALQPVFPELAKRQMAEMIEAITRANINIDLEVANARTCAQSAGYIAEEFQAETFNLDAILKGDKARAYTDKYPEWKQTEWNGRVLKTNDVPDVVVVRDGEVTHASQLKYYQTAEDTAMQMSDTRNGDVYYSEMDSMLGPEDQINPQLKNVPGEREQVATITIKEHANAKADALEGTGADQCEIDAYRNTADKCTDRIADGDSSSTPLSKADAEEIASGNKDKLQQIENEYKTSSTITQRSQAAIGAAAMSAVVSGSINTLRYIQLAKEGKITAQEATIRIVGETAASAADSAIKASANTGVQSLMVRYGSEKAALQILSGQGMRSMLKTNAVTVGVVCAIDLIKDLVLLGMGNISKDQFYERQGKGVLSTTSGVVGAALGTGGAAGIATALGISAGSTAMAVASFIGGMSGGLIAGLAVSFAIENGIERPYQDLMRNTQSLRETTAMLERVSQNIFKNQILFSKFLESNSAMDQILEREMGELDTASKNAKEAISRI